MIERVLFAMVLLALILLGGWTVRSWARGRQRRVIGQRVASGHAASQATILYFGGPRCHVCQTLQTPALRRLEQAKLPSQPFEVRYLDATREEALAQQFGVLTLPTTVIVGADGTVKAINNGYAPEERLAAQLLA